MSYEEDVLHPYTLKPEQKDNKMEEEPVRNYAQDLMYWREFDVEKTLLAEKPTYVGDRLSKREVRLMYQCQNVRESLDAFTMIHKSRKGNWPPPSWFEFMVGSQYLNVCFHAWCNDEDKATFQNWVDIVYKVKPGKMFNAYEEVTGGKHDREIDYDVFHDERPTKKLK